MTKHRSGTSVVFNTGRGLVDGKITAAGIRVELQGRVSPAAGLISDGPGHALALDATEGDDVGQYRTKTDAPEAEPEPVLPAPIVGEKP
jgi:hypothetical protein